MWARRLLIGSGLALASVIAVPSTAGATGCGSMSGVSCKVTPTIAAKAVVPPSQLPETATTSVTSPPAASTTSLPFTGADIEGMAVVGVGAVLVGSILTRRRRRPVDA